MERTEEYEAEILAIKEKCKDLEAKYKSSGGKDSPGSVDPNSTGLGWRKELSVFTYDIISDRVVCGKRYTQKKLSPNCPRCNSQGTVQTERCVQGCRGDGDAYGKKVTYCTECGLCDYVCWDET
uniref:Uncharacterized protein n=1 Tax=Chromera velia CCMP2878 TaxID=1169474 RepID=A0A0G4HPI0_9ALVE|eukprot:Cvel_7842.t1-p1 / transcript=Cvel_7842.t1 / gene=Cvel_7842 / organism=Chromera_velia_CCMP2878 / gene_product=hypothetical protein / transcript_product=hypothetical protein / location=Cvel_scaffold419:57676-58044(+) / protein_length=123 / sequence_SO=supercontig / SO=protein_coding / is_pseudo=false